MFMSISLQLYTSRFVLSSLIGQQSQASILGAGDVATPRFWAGGRGVAGGRGGHERVVKHYYILSCAGSRPMFENDDFSSEME